MAHTSETNQTSLNTARGHARDCRKVTRMRTEPGRDSEVEDGVVERDSGQPVWAAEKDPMYPMIREWLAKCLGLDCAAATKEDELEAHYRRHDGCPRCAGEGEIPDTTTTDGGTRLCPGPHEQ
jgi:hypothetical protein